MHGFIALLAILGTQVLTILFVLWYDRRFISVNEILKVTWRSSGLGTVGITLVKCHDGMKRCFIGIAKSEDADADAARISAYGAGLSFREASAFFDGLKEEEYSEERM